MLTDKLRVYLKLDETSGTTAINNADSTNDWSNANATVNQTGILNQCYLFNGTSAVLSPTSQTIGTTDSFTLSAWVKLGSGEGGNILGRGQDGFGNGWSIQFTVTEGGTADINIVTTSGGATLYQAIGTTTLSADTWYHVVAVWDAGVSLKIYLNGAVETTTNTSTTSLRTSTVGETIALYSGSYYKGYIDEFGMWTRALSAGEVAALYNSGTPLAFPFTSLTGGVEPLVIDATHPLIKEYIQTLYAFDSFGPEYTEKTGSTRVATSNGGLIRTSGANSEIPNSVYLDGSHYISFSADSIRTLATGSIVFWVRGDFNGIPFGILTDSSNNRQFSFSFVSGSVSMTMVDAAAGAVVTIVTCGDTIDEGWHQIAYVNQAGGSGFQIYIDTKLQALTYDVGSAVDAFCSYFMRSTDDFQLGNKSDSGNLHTAYGNGFVAQLGIWNIALTAGQLRDLYTDPMAIYQDDKSWWMKAAATPSDSNPPDNTSFSRRGKGRTFPTPAIGY